LEINDRNSVTYQRTNDEQKIVTTTTQHLPPKPKMQTFKLQQQCLPAMKDRVMDWRQCFQTQSCRLHQPTASKNSNEDALVKSIASET